MVLLSTLAVFFGIGIISWVVGEFFSYPGVASAGAVMIIITGSAIALTGLQYKSGELHSPTAENGTEIDYQYSEVAFGGIFPSTVLGELASGGLLMLLGTAMMSQTLRSQIE